MDASIGGNWAPSVVRGLFAVLLASAGSVQALDWREQDAIGWACGGIGYRGRAGIYEVLEVDGTLADLVSDHASNQTIWRAARAAGMVSLLDDGKAKTLQHVDRKSTRLNSSHRT